MNKKLLQFIDWLEGGDRERWEIEKYVEDLLTRQKEEIKRELKKIQILADKEQCLETDLALQNLLEKL